MATPGQGQRGVEPRLDPGGDRQLSGVAQPADEWKADWDLSGQAQDIELFYEVGSDLANSKAWPEWQAGSEFKALRDTTAADRK